MSSRLSAKTRWRSSSRSACSRSSSAAARPAKTWTTVSGRSVSSSGRSWIALTSPSTRPEEARSARADVALRAHAGEAGVVRVALGDAVADVAHAAVEDVRARRARELVLDVAGEAAVDEARERPDPAGRGHLGDRGVLDPQRPREAQDELAEERLPARQRRAGDEVAQRLLDSPLAHGALGHVRQVGERDLALHEVVDRARPDRLDGHALAAVARHDHDRRHRPRRLRRAGGRGPRRPAAASRRSRGAAGASPLQPRAGLVDRLRDGDRELARRGPRTRAARARRGRPRPRRAARGGARSPAYPPRRPESGTPPSRPRTEEARLRGRPAATFIHFSEIPARAAAVRPAERLRGMYGAEARSRANGPDPPRHDTGPGTPVRGLPADLRGRASGAPQLYALECLIRGPRETNVERPVVLFDYVRRKRAEAAVDRACIETALAAAGHLPFCPRLSLNVHASTLGRDLGFPAFLLDRASGGRHRRPRPWSSRSSSTLLRSTCRASARRSPRCARPASRSPSTTSGSASRTTR